jgi:sulfatase maturation enzyme AslB (radical SAM superfamily)
MQATKPYPSYSAIFKFLRKIQHLCTLGLSYKLKLLLPISPPYNFAIEATNRCNFKCLFCPQSDPNHKNLRPRGNLTADNFLYFLSKIKAVKSGNSNISICLDGEPLMNNFFFDFIQITNNEGLYPRFSSNGKLLVPSLIDKLSQYKFLASIDFSSEKKIFEQIRGNKGDYDIILQNLLYLVEKAKIYPWVSVEIVDITNFFGDKNIEKSFKKMRQLFPPKLPPNINFLIRKFHNFCGHLGRNKKKDTYKLCPYP